MVQLVVAAWVMTDVVKGRTSITRAQLRPGRLWLLAPVLLAPVLLALLMPAVFEHGTVTPSLASALWNEAGVTYCMITPVVLAVLLIFVDGVARRTLAMISFVGLGFGLVESRLSQIRRDQAPPTA